MSNFRIHHLSAYLRVFVFLAVCSWVASTHAQTVTWQDLPWPADQNWGGPQGSPAVTNGNQITLTGQDVLSAQTFTGPLTISYDALLPSKTTVDGGLNLLFVPPGESTNLVASPDLTLY